jgi:AraC-like DNA-binding protein
MVECGGTIMKDKLAACRALYLWEGRAMYIGEVLDNTPHSHHALQVVVSTGKPFSFYVDGRRQEGVCAVIAPDKIHQLEGTDTGQILLLIDPEAAYAHALASRYLAQNRVCIMPDVHDAGVFRELGAALSNPDGSFSCNQAALMADQVMAMLLGDDSPQAFPMNERIRRVIEVIKGLDAEKISVGEIAQKVFLSESRLIHLFTREMGIPIRRYLLWRRLGIVVRLVLSGSSLTDAAHGAGFSDSAHMSRTFRDMFGYSPSDILKNSRFIQVISCIA